MNNMKIYLRDLNPAVCYAWQEAFAGTSHIDIAHDDIFSVQADAVISPANSFGFMDGGIDLIYSQVFGLQLQHRLQEIIRDQFDGELPVGMAVVLETFDERIPYLISAPTMRVPQNVAYTANAYLAFKAALHAIGRHNRTEARKIESVACPGLATAIGEMPASACARQMRIAYDRWLDGNVWSPKSVSTAKRDHEHLAQLEKA